MVAGEMTVIPLDGTRNCPEWYPSSEGSNRGVMWAIAARNRWWDPGAGRGDSDLGWLQVCDFGCTDCPWVPWCCWSACQWVVKGLCRIGGWGGNVVGRINVCFKSRMGCLSEYYPMIHLKLNENGKVNSSVDFNAGGERWGDFYRG
jgi:hypothetical protein